VIDMDALALQVAQIIEANVQQELAKLPAGEPAPTTEQLTAAVLARLQPLYIRVQDARGPDYSTGYQEVRLGTKKQYVTLPFGPRN
jgi:hypothetical protein